jgi:hypothetical protein
MSDFDLERGTATLICGRTRLETRYLLHIDLGGRAVMVELFDRPQGLACGDTVRLLFRDGRALECQVLDDSAMCTIVGEGLRFSAS